MKTPWNWLSFFAGLGGALLILGGIWIAVAVDAQVRAEDQRQFEACMAALGFPRENPGTDLQAVAVAAEICGR